MKIIFDIDDTIVVALNYSAEEILKSVKENLGQIFLDYHLTESCDTPHLLFPGFFALFRWLYKQGVGFGFFSSGTAERNTELMLQVLKRAFPKGSKFDTAKVPIFSREHCLDTEKLPREESELLQGYFEGIRKKKLVPLVCDKAELPDTLLVDDDSSYMVKGEEKNFVKVRATHSSYLPHSPKEYHIFHKSYYLCALFSRIFELKKNQNISLAEAAWKIQVEATNQEFGRNFYYPLTDDVSLYSEGLKILQQIDPSLQFYITEDQVKKIGSAQVSML